MRLSQLLHPSHLLLKDTLIVARELHLHITGMCTRGRWSVYLSAFHESSSTNVHAVTQILNGHCAGLESIETRVVNSYLTEHQVQGSV